MSESDSDIIITTDDVESKSETGADQAPEEESERDVLLEEVKQGKQRLTRVKLEKPEPRPEPETRRVSVADWIYTALTLGGKHGDKNA